MYLFRKVFAFYSSHLSKGPHGGKEWETVRPQHLEITFPINEMQRCQPDRALSTQVGVKYSSWFNRWENVISLASGVIVSVANETLLCWENSTVSLLGS